MTAGEKIAGLLAAQGTPRLRASMGAILLLAWPAIVEQLMITLVQYVDTAMVGSLGSMATAAVGLTASTTWLFGGMFNAASIGFSVQVAQHLGAGRQKQARDVTWQALRFVVIFGLLLGGIAFALSFPLPAMLGAEAAVRPQASLYFRIIACAMPFTLGANMCSAILRCAGDTKTPMVLNLMINALNVVLNFIFIYPSRTITLFGSQLAIWGAGWGVGGAAFASGCSTAVVFLLFVVVLIYKRSPVQIKWRERCGFQKECLLAVWRLGLPAALERATLCVAQIVITAIITGIGTVAVAANHLAVTAESISYLPASGVAVAGTTLVGQAIGAGRKDLAKRFARMVSWMGIAIMTLGGALLFTLAPQLIRIFSQDPPGDFPRCPGPAHRRLCRAPLRRFHSRLRCPPRRRGFQRPLLHQPGHHVGRAHHPFPFAGRFLGLGRRLARHGRRTLRPRPYLYDSPLPRQVAAHFALRGLKTLGLHPKPRQGPNVRPANVYAPGPRILGSLSHAASPGRSRGLRRFRVPAFGSKLPLAATLNLLVFLRKTG